MGRARLPPGLSQPAATGRAGLSGPRGAGSAPGTPPRHSGCWGCRAGCHHRRLGQHCLLEASGLQQGTGQPRSSPTPRRCAGPGPVPAAAVVALSTPGTLSCRVGAAGALPRRQEQPLIAMLEDANKMPMLLQFIACYLNAFTGGVRWHGAACLQHWCVSCAQHQAGRGRVALVRSSQGRARAQDCLAWFLSF